MPEIALYGEIDRKKNMYVKAALAAADPSEQLGSSH